MPDNTTPHNLHEGMQSFLFFFFFLAVVGVEAVCSASQDDENSQEIVCGRAEETNNGMTEWR